MDKSLGAIAPHEIGNDQTKDHWGILTAIFSATGGLASELFVRSLRVERWKSPQAANPDLLLYAHLDVTQ